MGTVLDDLPDDVEVLRAALRLAHLREQEKSAEAARLAVEIAREREEKALILTANTQLSDQIAALKLINLRLEKLISRYERLQYGPTSEKLNPDQLQLALEEIEQAVATAETEAEKLRPDPERKAKSARKRGERRPSLPSHLPEVASSIEQRDVWTLVVSRPAPQPQPTRFSKEAEDWYRRPWRVWGLRSSEMGWLRHPTPIPEQSVTPLSPLPHRPRRA